MFFRSITGIAVACGLLLTAFAGHAADMPAKAPPQAIAPAWTGFYAGLHTGWGFGDAGATSRTDIGALPFFAPARFDLSGNGPLFGAQLGYNWQTGNWVLGVEADISGSGISGFESRVPFRVAGAGTLFFGADSLMRQSVNWLVSARGRLGYAWGTGLIYATGGAAWANIDYQANTTEGLDPCGGYGCSLPANFNGTRSGWAVGGGYEWTAASNWSLRGEYLYYSFGGATAAARTVSAGIGATCPSCLTTYQWGDLAVHAVRLGLNYRWGGVASAQASMSMPAPAPVAKDWSGFYAGVHGGWAFARGNGLASTAIDRPPGFFLGPNSYNLNADGPLFGGQVGYNWQIANWVAGVEGDISGAGIRGFHAQPPYCPQIGGLGCAPAGPQLSAGSFMKQDVTWLASLRGRFGHAWGPGMIYVTGGAALAGIDYQANLTDGFGPGSAFPVKVSTTRSGWVAGGGYEWPAWSNWTVRGEYLYYRLDDFGATATSISGITGCRGDNNRHCSATYRWDGLDVHALRLGLNYKL